MAKPKLHVGETNERPIPRCMLYKGAASKIFTGDDEIEAAMDEGWEDEPSADQTAEAAPVAAFDHAAADRLAELNELLQVATTAADELKDDLGKTEEDLVEANETLADETKRADSAEKKLVAAEKKLAANANK